MGICLTPPARSEPRHLSERDDPAEQRLFVSPNIVKSQLRALDRKLGVASRQEALQTASERRQISSWPLG